MESKVLEGAKDIIYKGCEYLLLSNDEYFTHKYRGLLNFEVEDTVEEVLGEDWKTLQRPIVKEFRRRMFWKNQKIDNIAEPIIYGKIIEQGSPYRLSELVLLSEIALNKSIAEVDKLLKSNKVKLKTI